MPTDPATIPDFLAALQDYLRGVPALALLRAIHYESVPPESPYPYIIITRITSVDVPTNSPTTAMRRVRVQYDAFDLSERGVRVLGDAAYSALSRVTPKVAWVSGAEFLRNQINVIGPRLERLTVDGNQEWRTTFEVEHHIGELI